MRRHHRSFGLVVFLCVGACASREASAPSSFAQTGATAASAPTDEAALGAEAPAGSPEDAPAEEGGNEDAPAADELTLRFFKRGAVRCDAGQTNTPCAYAKGSGCMLRASNCTGKPCSEGLQQPIECGAVVGARPAPAPVCLRVQGLRGTAVIRIFEGEQQSSGGTGTSGADAVLLCGEADRDWRVQVGRGGEASFGAKLDWSRAACFTLDLPTRAVSPSCVRDGAAAFEGRL